MRKTILGCKTIKRLRGNLHLKGGGEGSPIWKFPTVVLQARAGWAGSEESCPSFAQAARVLGALVKMMDPLRMQRSEQFISSDEYKTGPQRKIWTMNYLPLPP